MAYKVLDTTEVTRLTGANRLAKEYRVTVSVDDKGTFTVNIPAEEFNAENAKKAIEAEVAKHRAILKLGE